MTGPTAASARRRILALSQVYPPDPASVGQHLADACAALARRGAEVEVITAAAGYDDASIRYPAREQRDGVTVRRLPWSSFGKGSMALRLLGGLSFTVQCIVRGLSGRAPDTILVSTVPPMIPLAALALARLRASEIVYWVMDLNPDQVVALGRARPTQWNVRALNWMQSRILFRARAVVVLDRFMAERMRAKGPISGILVVLPPWPHHADVIDRPAEHSPFRAVHALGSTRVIMYSGNHALAHPLDTALAAAVRLREDPRLRFVFVGGGATKPKVEAVTGPSIRSLPYQPLETLADSLSAADVHLVVMGNEVVGINHPCKVYGAMAVSRPILFVGPADSHVGDMIREHGVGWHVAHGDVDGMVRVLEEIAAMPREQLTEMGRRAGALVADRFSRARLEGAFVDVVLAGDAAA